MRRLLRDAIVYHRLFQEPQPGVVTHGLASCMIAEEPLHPDAPRGSMAHRRIPPSLRGSNGARA